MNAEQHIAAADRLSRTLHAVIRRTPQRARWLLFPFVLVCTAAEDMHRTAAVRKRRGEA